MKKNTSKTIAGKKDGKVPFYAQLLTRHETQNIAAGGTSPLRDQIITQTLKYPSDTDETSIGYDAFSA